MRPSISWHSPSGGTVAYFYTSTHTIALRSPANKPLFSERNRASVKRVPLGFGWRITIRRRIGA